MKDGSIKALRQCVATRRAPRAGYRNKPDIGLTIALQWLDRNGADAITDAGDNAVAHDEDGMPLATTPAAETFEPTSAARQMARS